MIRKFLCFFCVFFVFVSCVVKADDYMYKTPIVKINGISFEKSAAYVILRDAEDKCIYITYNDYEGRDIIINGKSSELLNEVTGLYFEAMSKDYEEDCICNINKGCKVVVWVDKEKSIITDIDLNQPKKKVIKICGKL